MVYNFKEADFKLCLLYFSVLRRSFRVIREVVIILELYWVDDKCLINVVCGFVVLLSNFFFYLRYIRDVYIYILII